MFMGLWTPQVESQKARNKEMEKKTIIPLRASQMHGKLRDFADFIYKLKLKFDFIVSKFYSSIIRHTCSGHKIDLFHFDFLNIAQHTNQPTSY